MITEKSNTEFWVITDTHLIADSLHDDGQAFRHIQNTSQGKDLAYQETALRAFVDFANKKKPAAIIVTGDVTFNGELVSAQKFAEIFSRLKATKLLVIPGNHDIYDGWARAFKGPNQLYAQQISPKSWQEIFKNSYDCALCIDPDSLAYSVQLNQHYLLILLDSNIYGKQESNGAPTTEGQINEEEIIWLEKQLENAKRNHLRPLLFMHHNLYVHNQAVNRGFVLNNAQLLCRLCQDFNIKLAFSGHIHAQNIVGPIGKTPAIEIVTSSFCSYDQGYGVIKVSPDHIKYQRHTFNMKPFLTKRELEDQNLGHFHHYLKEIQIKNLKGNSNKKDHLQSKQSELLQKVNHLFIEMNYQYFTGHNHIEKEQLKKLYSSPEFKILLKQRPRFSNYMKTLFDTTGHSNLEAEIWY